MLYRFVANKEFTFHFDKSLLEENHDVEIRCIKLNSDKAYQNEFPPLFSMKVDGDDVIKLDPAGERVRDTPI